MEENFLAPMRNLRTDATVAQDSFSAHLLVTDAIAYAYILAFALKNTFILYFLFAYMYKLSRRYLV